MSRGLFAQNYEDLLHKITNSASTMSRYPAAYLTVPSPSKPRGLKIQCHGAHLNKIESFSFRRSLSLIAQYLQAYLHKVFKSIYFGLPSLLLQFHKLKVHKETTSSSKM